jgi:methylenetetrahydrofolate reductase (NADPH)
MTNTISTNRLTELLEHPRYEVLPFGEVVDKVLACVPRDMTLTVTVSPRKGIEHTLDVVETLRGHGYAVVPHVSARLVRDRTHLAEILARMEGLEIDDVFVVAGDADEPVGEFEGAGPLLEAMAEIGHRFERIGITGYPESHPLIPDETVARAMAEKARFATYVVSQICFDAKVTANWIDEVWEERGIRLPIYVGIPGAVPTMKLMRVSTTIGIGASMRFLRRHRSWFGRALRPGGFDPDPLIEGLVPTIEDPERRIAGFHIFTFNDVADTEEWRQRRLADEARPK